MLTLRLSQGKLTTSCMKLGTVHLRKSWFRRYTSAKLPAHCGGTMFEGRHFSLALRPFIASPIPLQEVADMQGATGASRF